MERVIVFGGTGKLGRIVATAFEKPGVDVIALGRDISDVLPEPSSIVFCQRERGREVESGVNFTINAMEWISKAQLKSVVIVSSVTGSLVAPQCHPGYHAAKAAMRQLGRYYAVTLKKECIRVNVVSPGDLPDDKSRIQVAQVIVWLCSDAASGVNGAEIVVDGGSSIIQQGP